MDVQQIESLPYELNDIDYNVDHILDLIGQTKLRSEFNVLFCNYSDADIKAVYGCPDNNLSLPLLKLHVLYCSCRSLG